MENEIVTKSANELATTQAAITSRAMENIDPDDFVIPYIRVIQRTSNTDDIDVNLGDIVSSDGDKVLGTLKKGVNFVVVKALPKTFTVSKKVEGIFRWVSVEPWDIKLKNEWLFERDGVEHKREKTFNFYILLEGDMVPSKLSVRGASVKTGAQISTDIMKLSNFKKLPWDHFMLLKSKSVTKGQKKYCVLLSELLDDTNKPSDELKANAAMWEKIVSQDPSSINEQSENDVSDDIPF